MYLFGPDKFVLFSILSSFLYFFSFSRKLNDNAALHPTVKGKGIYCCWLKGQNWFYFIL